MAISQTQCLYTVVQNTSGSTLPFSMIPPHGVTLAPNAQYSVAGDLVGALGAGVHGSWKKRKFTALANALLNGLLQIVSSPGLFLFDNYDGKTRMLHLKHGGLGTVDPCWAGTSSFAAV
jgi:hypothetical protein